MSEPTVTLNPTEQLVAAANATHELHDAKGRVIVLRHPGVLAQYRLVEALGNTAKNETYMGMVLPLLYVGSVDGEAVNALTSKLQVEALIQRLDEAGIAAVMQGVSEHWGAPDPEADRATLKN